MRSQKSVKGESEVCDFENEFGNKKQEIKNQQKISGEEFISAALFNIQLLLAATATTVVAASTIWLTAVVAVAAAEEDDYQDDDPRTRVVITKNITHKFVPPFNCYIIYYCKKLVRATCP